MDAIDPDEIADAREEFNSSLVDTAHILRDVGAGDPGGVTGLPDVSGTAGQFPDGQGGFTSTPPTDDGQGGREANWQEINTYPCTTRLNVRGTGEQIAANKPTAYSSLLISLPWDAVLLPTDRIQVSVGRASDGGPTFDPFAPVYEVSSVAKQRSNQLLLQARLELIQ